MIPRTPGPSPLRRVAAAAIFACLALAWCGGSTGASRVVAATSEPAAVDAQVTVGGQGAALPSEYLGVSLEASALCDLLEDDATNGAAYEQLYRNLGAGVLHVGGFSSDTAEWDPTGTASCGSPTVLTDGEVGAFFAFAQRIGWEVLWGLPLELPDPPVPAMDAAEAAYVASVAGGSLAGFTIGNEPNLYVANGERPRGWGPTDYYQEWAGVRAAVIQAVPGAGIVAPEVCCADAVFTQTFDAKAVAAGDRLSGLSFHYYAPFGKSDHIRHDRRDRCCGRDDCHAPAPTASGNSARNSVCRPSKRLTSRAIGSWPTSHR